MGHKATRYRYVQAKPAAKNPRWCAAWWPRNKAGELAWVTLRIDAMSWTTIPDGDCLIPPDQVQEVKEFFAEENAPRKFTFRTRSAK